MPRPAEQEPLRCHLLIGPPASGKSTLAAVLAELTGATIIATDALRQELYGDAATQGEWSEVEAKLHSRLSRSVAQGCPVIVDATHCLRPWRLAITQALEVPAPVQWIGWWLTTPLNQCLDWNQRRERQVDATVVARMLANLNERHGAPERQEGFAQVIKLNPDLISDLQHHVGERLTDIDLSLRSAAIRMPKPEQLHRYSRLLDLERLIFLIRLLLEFPGLELVDDELPDAQQLRRSFRFDEEAPMPPADALFAERAAFALAHRHGPCFADEDAIAIDLGWLEQQGFVSALPVKTAINPGPASPCALQAHAVVAGFPAAADRDVFQRQFGLLRHLIQNPFDHPIADLSTDLDLSPDVARTPTADPKTRRKRRKQGPSLREYLLERLTAIDGVDYCPKKIRYRGRQMESESPQIRTLDKDIELLIGHYGFRDLLCDPHVAS